MSKKSFFTLILLCLIHSVVQAANKRFVVTGTNSSFAKSEMPGLGGEHVRDLVYFEGFVANMSETAVERLSEIFGASIQIEEDFEVSVDGRGGNGGGNSGGTTPPPAQQIPWGIDAVGTTDALTYTNGSGATVCVLDSGIQDDHPDLASNIIGGENFVSSKGSVDPNNWDDENGHGTHVAGTIAALDNTVGVVGVAPGASLFASRVLDRRGSGYTSDVADGIVACVDSGNADVINMSLGSSSGNSLLANAVAYADSMGVILVAAAGNDAVYGVSFPAAYPEVIAVSAVDVNFDLAWFSNYGPEIDYAAPGVGVYSTYKGSSYSTLNGTSMASPHVAGVAALMVADGEVSLVGTDIGLTADQQGLGFVDALLTVQD